MPLPEFFDYVLERSGYQAWVERDSDAKRRLANLRLLRGLAARYADATDALGTFLSEVSTMGDADVERPEETRGVTLATIHTVKGLEFPVVFIAGMEEGIFPHAKAMKTPEGMEEETRLAYVAMTRAMQRLYLTCARSRMVGEEMQEHAPSRFLGMIPRELVERLSASRAIPVELPMRERVVAEARAEYRVRRKTKDEGRKTKDEGRRTKDERRRTKDRFARRRTSSLVIRHPSFVIGHPSFVIGHPSFVKGQKTWAKAATRSSPSARVTRSSRGDRAIYRTASEWATVGRALPLPRGSHAQPGCISAQPIVVLLRL